MIERLQTKSDDVPQMEKCSFVEFIEKWQTKNRVDPDYGGRVLFVCLFSSLSDKTSLTTYLKDLLKGKRDRYL